MHRTGSWETSIESGVRAAGEKEGLPLKAQQLHKQCLLEEELKHQNHFFFSFPASLDRQRDLEQRGELVTMTDQIRTENG